MAGKNFNESVYYMTLINFLCKRCIHTGSWGHGNSMGQTIVIVFAGVRNFAMQFRDITKHCQWVWSQCSPQVGVSQCSPPVGVVTMIAAQQL